MTQSRRFAGLQHRILVAALITALVGVAGPSQAQAGPSKVAALWGGAVGAGRLYDSDAGENVPGAVFQLTGQLAWPYVALRVHALDVALVRNTDDSYSRDCFANGNCVCRDASNGQFADDENCGPVAKFAVAAEGAAAIPLHSGRAIEVGGGYRLGFTQGPYGLVSWLSARPTQRHWFVRGAVGRATVDVLGATVGSTFFTATLGGAIPFR